MNNPVKPYKNGSLTKKKEVAMMFNKIAHRYDFLNHFLSLNIDKWWRKKSVRQLDGINANQILDLACGTGDLSIQLHKKFPEAKITGVDISKTMLKYGRAKIKKQKLEKHIKLLYGDSENLPFKDACFEIVTTAFGVRNFDNLSKSLLEMNRVLKPNGTMLILEFSKITKFPLKQIYNFYLHKVLPLISRIFSKDRAAYKYLPESVGAFSNGNNLIKTLEKSNFKNIEIKPLTFGVVSMYIATKKTTKKKTNKVRMKVSAEL